MSEDKQARERLNLIERRLNLLERLAIGVPYESPSTALNFGQALDWMKKGKKVGQWHRDTIYVFLQPADRNKKAELRVKTISGEFAAWTPNHHELLSDTWRVIEDEE